LNFNSHSSSFYSKFLDPDTNRSGSASWSTRRALPNRLALLSGPVTYTDLKTMTFAYGRQVKSWHDSSLSALFESLVSSPSSLFYAVEKFDRTYRPRTRGLFGTLLFTFFRARHHQTNLPIPLYHSL